MKRLRGLRQLVHDAVHGITNLVEETHEAAARKPIAVLERIGPLEGAVRGVDEIRRLTAATVFGSVRAINQGVRTIGDAVDGVVAGAVDGMIAGASAASGGEPAPQDAGGPRALRRVGGFLDHAQGGLNAVLGDFLKAQGNGLAIEMGFWHAGRPLTLARAELARALPRPSPKLCVFVHGLGCTELVFQPTTARAPEAFAGGPAGVETEAPAQRVNYGAQLAAELDFTPIYVRYNTGLHVSENGRELARLLDALVTKFPVPVQQIALVGHSMGGLVARSAAHYASADARSWIAHLTHVLCVGSPHLGAPLEKASNALASALGLFDVAGTQVPAKLLNARSAGIKDLRFGYVLDEEWTARDPDSFLRDERRDVPFADGVTYGFVAATCFADGSHPLGPWLGDLLVRVPSASGAAPDRARRIPFHIGHVLSGIHHHALLTHPAVYTQLVRFLTPDAEAG